MTATRHISTAVAGDAEHVAFNPFVITAESAERYSTNLTVVPFALILLATLLQAFSKAGSDVAPMRAPAARRRGDVQRMSDDVEP